MKQHSILHGYVCVMKIHTKRGYLRVLHAKIQLARMANSEDPDQTAPPLELSDQGLHCLL